MTTKTSSSARILGSLRSAGGVGVVRVEDRFDTDIEDLWSAVTEPPRLARWLGNVEGDLRPGGRFHAVFHATGWEGSGRINTCERPKRLLLTTKEPDEPDEVVVELTFTADGGQTVPCRRGTRDRLADARSLRGRRADPHGRSHRSHR